MKKRIFGLFLIISMLVFAGITASAEIYSGNCGTDGDNLTWELDTDTGALLISGTGDMEDYVSPSVVPWHSNRALIKTVTASQGVTNISNYAFALCESLAEVILPDNLISIGDKAFHSCISLKRIDIPDGIKSIGYASFIDCSSLREIVLPNSITSIDIYAFLRCDSLTDVYYTGTEDEWSAISIGSNNTSLTDATIHYNHTPSSVTASGIGKYAENVSVSYKNNNGIVTSEISIVNDAVAPEDIMVFVINMTNGTMSTVAIPEKTVSGDSISISFDVTGGVKLLIWDPDLCPVTNAIEF